MKLGMNNKLFCLAYGIATLRIFDVETGERVSIIDAAPVDYQENQMLYHNGMIYQGGLNELFVIEEETC